MATKRLFRGNRRYVSFYNQHVAEFFDNETEAYANSKHNVVGGVLYQNQTGFPQFLGSYWSSKEKNQFFKSLSRHSIHNVDIIAQEIGTKSVIEIYHYYELLAKELRYHKSKAKRTGINIANKTYYHKRPNKHLLSYKQMPICHEMSPLFLKFEEAQLNMILRKEYLRINDSNKFFKHHKEGEEFFNTSRLEALIRLYQVLGKRANPHHDGKMSFIYVKTLEAIVKHVTSDFVLKLINVYVPGQIQREITVEDVKQHIGVVEGFWNKHLYEAAEFGSVGIRQEEILGSTKQVQPRKPVPILLADRFVEDQEPEILSIEDLPRYDPFSTNKPFKEIVEEELLVLETGELEEKERIELENEQHKLLAYFDTMSSSQDEDMGEEEMDTEEIDNGERDDNERDEVETDEVEREMEEEEAETEETSFIPKNYRSSLMETYLYLFPDYEDT